jgi:hypothetical protein
VRNEIERQLLSLSSTGIRNRFVEILAGINSDHWRNHLNFRGAGGCEGIAREAGATVLSKRSFDGKSMCILKISQ